MFSARDDLDNPFARHGHSMPADAAFIFSHGPHTLRTAGVQEVIQTPADGSASPDGPLQQHIREAFGRARSAGIARPIVVGAVPFDVHQPSCLFVPQQAEWLSSWDTPVVSSMPGLKSLVTQPDQAGFEAGVARAAAACAAHAPAKAVLAITSRLMFTAPPSVEALRSRLRQQNPSGYLLQVPLPDGGYLVGVSPELLIRRHEYTVQSNPLAGSARRLPDPEADRIHADRLSASSKDHHEHRFVTDDIRTRLSPLCATLLVPEAPSLISTAALWHLSTQIHGTLQDPPANALQLACAIHPTPAVCGTPRDAADALIRSIEPFDRGLFTGFTGWMDADGNGEWVITIRSGVLHGDHLQIYAGAGIVAESDPHSEWNEVQTKQRTMLHACGIS